MKAIISKALKDGVILTSIFVAVVSMGAAIFFIVEYMVLING